jgi:hypothetical protein
MESSMRQPRIMHSQIYLFFKFDLKYTQLLLLENDEIK